MGDRYLNKIHQIFNVLMGIVGIGYLVLGLYQLNLSLALIGSTWIFISNDRYDYDELENKVEYLESICR